VTVVYGTMTDSAGDPMADTWVRLTQGSTRVLTRTSILGEYLFFDGQGCTNDGLDACTAGPTGTLSFASGTNVSTNLAVLGQGGSRPGLSSSPAMPGGKTSAAVSWSNGSANLGGNPSHTFGVTKGSAYARDWTFS
jgi:hypothetical protein